MMTARSARWLLPADATVLIAAAIAVAVLVSAGDGGDSRTLGEGSVAGLGGPSAPARPGDPSPAYVAAARTALPSVVQIQRPGGLGSSVVFDASGDIVTNAHVVGGEKRFVVVSADGGRLHATPARGVPVGRRRRRARQRRLTPGGGFGDSSQLRVGEAVLALSSPLGLRSSVTDGIVSAVSRTVSDGNGVALPSVVQTSAPINPGNSCGALVDLRGRVVGIPTLAALDPELGGAAPGVGFAISSSEVEGIASQRSRRRGGCSAPTARTSASDCARSPSAASSSSAS
jgi:putative serine protease PepD